MDKEKRETARDKRIKPFRHLFDNKGHNIWDKEHKTINSLTLKEVKKRIKHTNLKNIDLCHLLGVNKSTISRFNEGSFDLKFRALILIEELEKD